jgi:hypothetical protein
MGLTVLETDNDGIGKRSLSVTSVNNHHISSSLETCPVVGEGNTGRIE